MSKFKIGDKVRVVSDSDRSTSPGDVGEVVRVPKSWYDLYDVEIERRDGEAFPFMENEIELVSEAQPKSSYRSTALEVLRVVAEDPGATAGDRIRAAELLLVHEGMV